MKLNKKTFMNLGITFTYVLLIAFSIAALANKIIDNKALEIQEQTFIQQTKSASDSKNTIKVALLLDTSGSMDGLLSQAKSQLWSIINKLSDAKIDNEKPKLQIALYEYGNDRLSEENGYIKRIVPFSTDLDNISEKLFAMTTNGGSEYCGHVIQKSVNELDWGGNDNDLKMIFIAGNERFNQGQVSYRTASKNAKSKNIIINPIFCGDFDEGINTLWREAADITSGKYMSIEQNKKTVYIKSPYDDTILELNNKLNKTYIPYGSTGNLKHSRQMSQDKNASSYGSVNCVKRAVCKSKSVYKNPSWDLVDALEESGTVIEEMEVESLPEELQSLTREELKTYILEKKDQRNEIQKEINQLNSKRQKYVLKKEATTNNISNLGDALLKSIEKQAIDKGYQF